MAKPATVQEYLGGLTSEQRAVMSSIRDAIAAAAPRAELTISYSIPAFKLDGKSLLWFAAWKKHYSVYPITEAMARDHAEQIARYETSKGTIKFPADEPVPLAFIKKLARTRVKELKDTGR